jgi:heme exporter protein C
MKILKAILGFLVLVGVPAVTIHAATVPDVDGFLYPEFARVFFWHFPDPMMASAFIILGFFSSIQYSRTKDLIWDVRSAAAHELALIFVILTMLSGMLFSRIQWNAFWQNDPRQVSFLIVTVMYCAFFVLRSGLADEAKRATNSAGYAMSTFLPFVFLTFVFPRLPQVVNNHPNDTIMKGNIRGGYLYVTLEILTLVTIVSVWLYRNRVAANLARIEAEKIHGIQVSRRNPSDNPVVRVMPLSVSNRETN